MAQQQKTQGVEPYIDAEALEALPELTDQQAKFVDAILSGKTASDAYRHAYNTSNMKQNTIWSSASLLRSDPKVAAWIDAAKMANAKRSICTYNSHLDRLEQLSVVAERSGNMGAAVQAEVSRGKAAGLYVELRADVTPTSPLDALKEIAQYSPETAKALAQQAGIPLEKITVIDMTAEEA